MKNLLKTFGIIALVAVIGFSMVACEEDDDDKNIFDELSLNTGAPSAAALAAGGIDESQFNTIRDAGGGGFRGWEIDEDGDLAMYWSGRSEAQAEAIANAALLAVSGNTSRVGGEYADVSVTYDGIHIPKGALYLWISAY